MADEDHHMNEGDGISLPSSLSSEANPFDNESTVYEFDIQGHGSKLIRFVNIQYKIFVLWFNVISLLLGTTIIVICVFFMASGIHPYIHRKEAEQKRKVSVLVPTWGALGEDPLGNWATPFYLMVCLSGVVIFICASLGLLAAWSANKQAALLLHLVYVVFLFFVVVGEIFLCDAIVLSNTQMHIDARTDLVNMVKFKYKLMSDNSFTTALNIMMIDQDCCGVVGPHDFTSNNMTMDVSKEHSQYHNPPKGLYWPKHQLIVIQVPPACCKKEIFNTGTPEESFNNQIACAKHAIDGSYHNTKGCAASFDDAYRESYGMVSIVVTAIMVVFQMYTLLLVLLRIMFYIDERMHKKLEDRWHHKFRSSEINLRMSEI